MPVFVVHIASGQAVSEFFPALVGFGRDTLLLQRLGQDLAGVGVEILGVVVIPVVLAAEEGVSQLRAGPDDTGVAA